jgi:hypothetical protein
MILIEMLLIDPSYISSMWTGAPNLGTMILSLLTPWFFYFLQIMIEKVTCFLKQQRTDNKTKPRLTGFKF